MCGIAGLLFASGSGPVGEYLITMLRALQHRGTDSTGAAIYRDNGKSRDLILRVLAEDVVGALAKISSAIASVGGNIRNVEMNVSIKEGYGYDRYEVTYNGNIRRLVEAVEGTRIAKIISVGRYVEILKDTLPVDEFNSTFKVFKMQGSHGLGHIRFSTESRVDLFHAHPFQDIDNPDIVVVHNGQITNYWKIRRTLEMKGVRFLTDNDSELIVHYIAYKMSKGMNFEDALKCSIRELDGPFAYMIATPDALGLVRDKLGLRPLVMGVSEEVLVGASEEGASKQ
ncbi:MAG: ACT domain-containing protein [Candidatus Baldrarchaeia archaeon]